MRLARNWTSRLNRWLGALLLGLVTTFAVSSYAVEPFRIETAKSSQRYRIETLGKYAFVYTDRNFVFTAVPKCLDKSRYIATANSDKFSRGPALLTLRSEVPLVVYVGYDQRYRTKPNWLRRKFRLMPNLRLTMGNPKLGKTQVIYALYRAEFPPGRIEFGGNLNDTENSNFAMYTAIIVEASLDRCG